MTWAGVGARDFLASDEGDVLERRRTTQRLSKLARSTTGFADNKKGNRPVASAAVATAPTGHIERVKVAHIDTTVVVRAVRIDPSQVASMVAARQQGVEFAPLTLFRDPRDGTLHLPDGHHRREMYLQIGEAEVDALVYSGGHREAFLYALQLDRGLKRTTKDKQHCVEILLGDPEWVTWSNLVLAEAAGVDEKTVKSARTRLGLVEGPRKARDGRVYAARETKTQETATAVHLTSNPEIPDCSERPQKSIERTPPRRQSSASDVVPDGGVSALVAWEASVPLTTATPADITLDLALDGSPVEVYDGGRMVVWHVARVVGSRLVIEGRIKRSLTVVERHGDVMETITDGDAVDAARRKLRGEAG